MSKSDVRDKIEAQVRDYLRDGGTVESVSNGVSGWDSLRGSLHQFRTFQPQPKTERTYVPEVIAAIEARRRKPKEPKLAKQHVKRMVRRAVFDDFGEAVRYEWTQE